MSQRRSGLLSGLIIGFIAALLCATGVAAAVHYADELPEVVVRLGDGAPLVIVLAVLVGLVVGLAIRAIRPRSLVLPPVAAVYAGAAVMAGLTVGDASTLPHLGSGPYSPADVARRGPAALPSLDTFVRQLDLTASVFFSPIDESWRAWLVVAIAALVAFVLVALRVRRLRRDTTPSEPSEPFSGPSSGSEAPEPGTGEPEFRAPFEPAQAPTQQSTADLFTPRKPPQS